MSATVRVWPGRRVRRIAHALPAWMRAVGGVVVAVAGLCLVTRPLTSLEALTFCVAIGAVLMGGIELLRRDAIARRLGGVVWMAIGVAIAVWPGSAVGWIGIVISLGLLVTGGLRVWGVRRGPADARITAVLLGLAEIGLGVAALAWPDVTLVTVAAVFGVRLALLGVSLLLDAVSDRRRRKDRDHPGTLRRTTRLAWSAIAFVLVLGVLVSSAFLRGSHDVGTFYSRPDDAAASGPAGQLLRTEEFTRGVPSGARGWKILYRTRDTAGRQAVASAVVVAPRGGGGHPVIAWAHGTTGLAQACAPSLLDAPLSDGGFPDVLSSVVKRGWAVVATDYPGLGTAGTQPYLIGRGEAYSVLDSVRAARDMRDVAASDQTVVWGHSQGGGAALWTSEVQPTYAPDVPLSGTAAMAPAADLPELVDSLTSTSAGAVFAAFIAQAYAATYPDVTLSDIVRPAARPLVKMMATRCLSDPSSLASVLTALSIQKQPVISADPQQGAWGRRLQENVPLSLGRSPVLIAQGDEDPLILPAGQAKYVAKLRAGGNTVDYRTYPGLDHGTLVEHGSALLPQLLDWTSARFAE